MGAINTILITGIYGYLGRNLLSELSKTYRVVGLDKPGMAITMLPNCDIWENSPENLEHMFSSHKIDVILHTATLYGRNNETPGELIQSNIEFPVTLLRLAKKYGVYGFVNTDTILSRGVNAYALSKAQCLEWLKQTGEGVKLINLKLEHFYGPGAPGHNFITFVIRQFLAQVPNVPFTKGEQMRDFVYISDIVAAYKTVLEQCDGLPGYTELEVTTGNPVKLKDLIIELANLTQTRSIPEFGTVPYRTDELMECTTNNLEIKKLGWSPQVPLPLGLKQTINSFKDDKK